uniref:Uncharacterized protein n=1 Tax=Arundo donax TaxID=35708 RepID=A0A0A9B219_ARUDO
MAGYFGPKVIYYSSFQIQQEVKMHDALSDI